MAKKTEGRIVSATGASANALAPGRRNVANAVQAAMTAAIAAARAEGITDPDEIRARMMAARAEVKAAAAEIAAQAAEADAGAEPDAAADDTGPAGE